MNNMQFGRNSVGLHQICIKEITVNIVLGTDTRVPVAYPGFNYPKVRALVATYS